VSDFRTGGKNIEGLIASVSEDRDDKHGLSEKVFRNFQETSTFFFVILTGDQNGRDMVLTKRGNQQNLKFKCDKDCENRLSYLIGAIISFVVCITSFVHCAYKKCFAEDSNKRVFNPNVALIVSWLLMGGVFLTLVAYQISPRFYLFLFPPFLILLGSFLRIVEEFFSKRGLYIVIVIVLMLTGFNLMYTFLEFSNLRRSRIENIEPGRDLIMNRSDRITIGQLRDVADFIVSERESKSVLIGDNRYARALYYLVSSGRGYSELLCYMKRSGYQEKNTLGRVVYVLVRDKSKNHIEDEMLETHFVNQEKSFGTLKLYELFPSDDSEREDLESCFAD
ncbi:hypothetical protein ACFL2R_03485, partial [Patescibacteria group bacterium]